LKLSFNLNRERTRNLHKKIQTQLISLLNNRFKKQN